MDEAGVERARIHPGTVAHTMDHYVLDIRSPTSPAAAYFTVYSLAYMPEVGTGHMGFLRIHDESGRASLDVTLAEDPEVGRRMQARMKRLIATTETSRGIGTDLDSTPLVASFKRLPFMDGRAGVRVDAPDLGIEGWWSDPDEPIFVAAPKGTLHQARDIVGTLIGFRRAELTVNGTSIGGEPYLDDWWLPRLGRSFSSCHFSLGDTSIEPAEDWW